MARKAQATKVGILVECGRDGLEVHLCRRICALLREKHGAAFVEDIVPMDNKERLLEECATAAALLFGQGCQRVVVLWDEEPAWPDRHKPLCWSRERQQILEALQQPGIRADSVHLVCIERACETWLLFDDDLLSRVLSRPTHRVRAQPPPNPHRLRNAKGVLTRVFKQHGRQYVDVTWAKRLADNLNELNRMLRCGTFRRFAERVSGQAL